MSDSQKYIAQSPKDLFSSKYLFVSISLSVIATAIVLYFTYTPEGWEYVVLKRMPGLVIACFVLFLKIWWTAAKIRLLADNKLTWAGAFRIVISWDFASAITPSTIGGAPLGIYAMTREHIPLGKASAITLYSLLLDQMFYITVIPILLIAGIYLEVIPDSTGFIGKSAMAVVYISLLGYGLILAYGVLVNPMSLKKAVRALFKLPFLRKHADTVERELDNLVDTSEGLRKKPISFLVKTYILASLAWMARASLPAIVVLSFLPADELLLFLRSFAMSFASLFMPTPGGSGGVEALFVIFLGPLFAREAFIGIATFMWRFITFYSLIGIGIMVMSWYLNNAVVNTFGELAAKEKKTSGDELSGSDADSANASYFSGNGSDPGHKPKENPDRA
ncbi:MAG: flippase-like domain-containing protein [Balneolia bacterium]|nr:flippase-like domain-containing protein [Balneolia bacterium]